MIKLWPFSEVCSHFSPLLVHLVSWYLGGVSGIHYVPTSLSVGEQQNYKTAMRTIFLLNCNEHNYLPKLEQNYFKDVRKNIAFFVEMHHKNDPNCSILFFTFVSFVWSASLFSLPPATASPFFSVSFLSNCPFLHITFLWVKGENMKSEDHLKCFYKYLLNDPFRMLLFRT